jgi:hypothetical protein
MAQGFPGQIAYEYMVVQYDNNGANSNFRILSATPATAGQLNTLGISGINRWTFPAATGYQATVTDNGNMISSSNTPSSFLAVTLPLASALSPGWTIGIECDNNKTMSVQLASGSTGAILLPGTLGSVTSFSLKTQALESAVLEYDGQNFRLMSMTPTSLTLLGGLLPQGTPATSSAACQTGAVEYDSNYLYLCTAPNTWKRSAWSSF